MIEPAQAEALLMRVPLFANLGRVELARLAAHLEPLAVAEGAELFRQGEAGHHLYIVADGALAVFVAAADAASAVRVATVSRGDLLGEMAVFTGEPRSATVRAERPSVVLALARDRLLALARQEPAISLAIVAILSERLRSANEDRLRHTRFISAGMDQALGRLPGERRDAVLEASLLEGASPAALRAMFGAQADAVAADLDALGVASPDGRLALRVLRERLERDFGHATVVARAEALAGRLAEAGCWDDALGVVASLPGPARLAGMLARALRAAPPLPVEQALRWVERIGDDEATRDGEVARARALLHESRGDPARALALLRRALGAALVGGDEAAGRRLSAELARLGSSRTVVTAAPFGPEEGPSRRGWRELPALLCLGAAALAVGAAAWPGGGPRWAFVWLLLSAVMLLMSRAVPDFGVGLVLLAGWLVLGVAGTAGALAGFATREWLFVVAIYGLAAATARSGLLLRIGLLLVRRLPPHVFWQTATLLTTGVVLTPLVPSSTGRASLISPLALAVADAMGLPERGRPAAFLGLGAWVGAGPLMFAFLNGSGTCLLAWGLLPEASRARFGWVAWLGAAAPLALFVCLASLVVLGAMFRPAATARPAPQRLSLQIAVLGPMSSRERAMIAVLGGTVGGWIAAPWLGLDLATVALLGLLATVAMGSFDGRALQSLDWSFLVFFGAVLSAGRLAVAVGLDRAATDLVASLLGGARLPPLAFVLAVAVVSVAARLLLDQDLTVVLLGVTLIPVAPTVGVEPWIVVIALLVTSVAWFVPAQTPSYLVAQSASEGRLFDHGQAQRFAFAYAVITLLGLALCVPYWRLLGLL